MQVLISKFGINELQIYYTIKKYEPNLQFVKDDALQEIRLAMQLSKNISDVFSLARSYTDRLMRMYRIKRDGNCRYSKELDFIYNDKGELNYSAEIYETEAQNKLKDILDYYENHTARETCDFFGIEYTQNLNKLLNLCAPKNLGHGGKRKGSGRKRKE